MNDIAHQADLMGLLGAAHTTITGVLDDGVVDTASDEELREAMDRFHRVKSAVVAVEQTLLAALDSRKATKDVGLSTAEFVHQTSGEDVSVSRAKVRQATTVTQKYPELAQDLANGNASEAQVRAAVEALDSLPAELGDAERAAALAEVRSWLAKFDPKDMKKRARRLVEVIAPVEADRRLRDKLVREEEVARKRRGIHVVPDGASMKIYGSLPVADGEQFLKVIDSIANKDFRRWAKNSAGDQAATTGRAAIDAAGQAVSDMPAPAALRADALMVIVGAYSASAAAPMSGGDRPRVNVTVTLEDLQSRLGAAELESGSLISVDQARILACDAEVLPMIFRQDGTLAWVGTGKRLFTGATRAAIIARDKQCVFPGCDRPPSQCEIHHVDPYELGGKTCMANGCLLCRVHHGLVEPGPHPNPDRWEARIGADGIVEFLPPRSLDPERRPRRQPNAVAPRPPKPATARA